MEKDWWNNLYFLPLNDIKNVADSFRGTAMKKNYRRKLNLQVINLIINFFELVSFFTSSVSYEKSLAIHS